MKSWNPQKRSNNTSHPEQHRHASVSICCWHVAPQYSSIQKDKIDRTPMGWSMLQFNHILNKTISKDTFDILDILESIKMITSLGEYSVPTYMFHRDLWLPLYHKYGYNI